MKYLAVDIGGTSIKYALMDEDAHIGDRGSIRTPLDSLEHLLDELESLFIKYKNEISGMAVSMPGVIDNVNGFCYTGGSLLYNQNINFVELLQGRCKTQITIENDGKCAALAEVWKGSLKFCNDGIVLVLGTGVGGGIIKDRKIHRGKHFSAGEFSFILTDRHSNNEIKDFFGFANGNEALRKLVASKKNSSADQLNGKIIFEMANKGDKDALDCIDKFARELAVQIHNLQVIFDPERVAIGGGISVQPLLIETTKKHLNKIYEDLIYVVPHAEIVPCDYFNDSNLIGALYNFLSLTKNIQQS